MKLSQPNYGCKRDDKTYALILLLKSLDVFYELFAETLEHLKESHPGVFRELKTLG